MKLKQSFLSLLLPVAMLATAKAGVPAPTIIAPEPPPSTAGPYFSVAGGAAFLQEVSTNGIDLQFDTGWSAIATFGYAFGNGIAVELESGYTESEFDKITFAGLDFGADGEYRQVPVVANVVFKGAVNDRLSVYIGAGAGAVWSESEFDSIGGVGVGVSDDAWSFIVQGKAGLSFAINDAISINAGYRVIYGFDSFDTTVGGGLSGEDDTITHIGELGVTFKF